MMQFRWQQSRLASPPLVFVSGCGGPTATWHVDPSDPLFPYIDVDGAVSKLNLPNGKGTFPTLPGLFPSDEGIAQWKDLVWKHALRTQVPAAFIAAIMRVESKGQANAINFGDNPHGVGLMQITSAALRQGKTDAELIDPDLNISIGADYLLQLSAQFAGNPIKVAAAYNAGGAYCGAMGGCAPNVWNLKTWCGGGLKTTPDYPGNVIKAYNAACDVGFSPLDAPTGNSNSDQPSNNQPVNVASASGSGILLVLAAVGGVIFLSRK